MTADHGFSTISKQSTTSPAAKAHYPDVPDGFLPPGFLAKDLSLSLQLKLWDPDQKNVPIAADAHSKFANGLLGDDPQKPLVIVAGNGGSDLIYLPPTTSKAKAKDMADQIVKFLLTQDYTNGLFVDARLGRIPGTLSLKDINLEGSAITPFPAIVINFKSFSSGCAIPTNCMVEVADTSLQQGQGMHGSFSRGDTFNFSAALGPDFKKQYVDDDPTSNADIGMTIAKILNLKIPRHGNLIGRVITEAMPDGTMPWAIKSFLQSSPGTNNSCTKIDYQKLGPTLYFDSAELLSDCSNYNS